MAVDLSAEIKRTKIADSLTNGDDDSDSESDPSTDEPETTDSTEETDSGKEPTESVPATQQGPAVQTFADYAAASAASPTPVPPTRYPTIAEDQTGAPVERAPSTTYPTIAEDQQGPAVQTFADYAVQPEAAPVPAGHIDLGPPGRNIYTDTDTGGRYVIDPNTGQMVPHAELATAADKAAQPPGGVVLPQQTVTGVGWSPEEGLPVPQDQVRRAQLVKLPTAQPSPEEGLPVPSDEVRRAQLVGAPPPKAQLVPPTSAQAVTEEGVPVTPTPPKVQPAQPVTGAPPPVVQAPVQPVTTQPVAGGIQTFADYSAGTVNQPKAAAAATQPAVVQKPVVQQGGDTGVADYFAKRGDKPISSANDTRLTTVTVGDQNYRVNKEAAPYFQGFLNELASKGAPVQAGDSWVYREKVGAKGLSDHAYGGAIDVNQGSLDRNKVSPAFQKWIDANPGVLQQIEKRWNIYGGERFGDLGHFEWGGAPFRQVAQQPAAGQPAAAGQVPAEAPIDIQSQSYTKGRTQEPTKLILHSTDGASEQADINTLTGAEPGHRVSVNYYVTKDGTVHHFVSENDTAWHAGADRYGGNGNAYTLGIEQQHVDGKEPWPDAQVRATAGVAAGILARHPNMTIDDVIGHSDLAGERKQDPVDYPWAKFRQYVAEAQGQPPAVAGQAAAPSAQPVTKLKTGFYQDEKPGDFLTGKATTFATPDDIATGQDNGRGAPKLGGVDTTQVAGLAIPQSALEQMFGRDWAAAARQARVDVVDQATGKRLRVPIVDLGPRGDLSAITDQTPALANLFGGGDRNLSIKIVPKAGPDVTKNPQLFYDEQAAIRNGFDSSTLDPKRQVIGQPQRFASVAQTPEEATAAQQKVQQAIQTQKDLLTKLPEAQGDNPNLIGYYKRLDDPVDGVSAPMRQAMQANLKPQIIAAMRQKFPDIKSDAEAWTKAQSDVGPLEVGAEAWSQVLGGFQQYTSVLQKGVAGTDLLHVNQFLDSALPGASDQDKHAYLSKLYAMPEDQRIAEVQSHLPQPQTGIPSTDPQQIVSSLDRLSSPDFQKQQAAELAAAQADMKRNLTTDPRLVRTGVGKIVDNVAQIPAFVAAYRNPVMLPLALAQTSDMARTQLRADHPDWDEKTIGENAARATVVMFLGQEAGAKLMGAGGGALLSSLEGGGKRAIAQALVGLGGGTAIGAGTQAGVNIATGQPIGRGVGEAAIAGLIQGGATGIVHGAGELIRPGERAAVAEPAAPTEPVPPTQPAAPPLRPVTQAEVTGPEVSETQPWYKPGPIVTRAEERTTFTPSELAEAVRNVPGGTPEEVQQRIENLQPEPDWARQGVFLDSSEAQQAEIDRAQAAQTSQPTPEQQAAVDKANIVSGATGGSQTGAEAPWVSKIANRFTAERMATGELGPVEPGTGVTKEEMLARGLKMGPEEINQHISDLKNNVGGDPILQASAVRAEEARLSQRSHDLSLISEADPTNSQAKIDAENAFHDLTDFHKGPVATLKSNWHAQGLSLQGEIPVDLSTYNGLREQFLKDVGNLPDPKMEPVLRATAKRVRDASAAETAAMNKLGAEIDRQSARRRLPSDEELRNNIMARMKDMPCST